MLWNIPEEQRSHLHRNRCLYAHEAPCYSSLSILLLCTQHL